MTQIVEHSVHGASKRRITESYRIHEYTYVRKKILAPLVLQPAPSLVRTSLRHCRYVWTTPTNGYSYGATAAWGVETSARSAQINAWAHTRRAPTAANQGQLSPYNTDRKIVPAWFNFVLADIITYTVVLLGATLIHAPPSDFAHKDIYKFTLLAYTSVPVVNYFFCGALNRRTTVVLLSVYHSTAVAP